MPDMQHFGELISMITFMLRCGASRVGCALAVVSACWSFELAAAEPPFSGTIFIDPDIVTTNDPTAFRNLADAGRGVRRMFDRRVNDWIEANAFLFNADFTDELRIEVQVNPEFQDAASAREVALRYLPAVGQLPTALREDVQTIWIHKGRNPFGGGNNNLLIHTEQATEYIATGILEETLIHESAHTSFDAKHAASSGWLQAQSTDPVFISTYARDNPTREDIAESFLPYFAIRYRTDRISETLRNSIVQAIPNRIAYFDAQPFDLYPAVQTQVRLSTPIFDRPNEKVTLIWNSHVDENFVIESSTDLRNWSNFATQIPGQSRQTKFDVPLKLLVQPTFFRIRL